MYWEDTNRFNDIHTIHELDGMVTRLSLKQFEETIVKLITFSKIILK